MNTTDRLDQESEPHSSKTPTARLTWHFRAAMEAVMAEVEAARGPHVRRCPDGDVLAGHKASQTRARLLEAAHDLFCRAGYRATTTTDISERAGVSVGTFYQYFSDRFDVLRTLHRDHLLHMIERTNTVWRTSEGRQGLFRIVFNMVLGYAENPSLARVWEEASLVEPEVAEIEEKVRDIAVIGIAKELHRGGRAGDCKAFSTNDAYLVAVSLVGMIRSLCSQEYRVDDSRPVPATTPEKVAELLTDLWAGAIGLKDEGSRGDPRRDRRADARVPPALESSTWRRSREA